MRLNAAGIDVLTGHAAARFQYVDVRDNVHFNRQRPRYRVLHIPLKELRARAPEVLASTTDIVVYGATDMESEAGEKLLRELGFENVWSFEGGFEALARAGLL